MMNDQEMTNPRRSARKIVAAAKPLMSRTARRFDASTQFQTGLFAADDPGDEGRDLPISRLALVEVERHRLVGLVGPHEAPDFLHRLDELTLGGADLLDRLALHGRGGLLEASQGVGEPLFIVEDAHERRLVQQDQSIPDDVHLNADCLLDLAGGVDPLSGLIHEPAMPLGWTDRTSGKRGSTSSGDCRSRGRRTSPTACFSSGRSSTT